MKKEGIRCITIEAKDHYEFGFKVGSKLNEEIKSRLAKNKKAYSKRGVRDYSSLVKFSKKFLPAIQREVPFLLDYLHGLSKGSGAKFDDLLVLACEEEVLDFRVPGDALRTIPHCTNIGIRTQKGDILLGHNEDWIPEYRENGFVIIKGTLGKKKFISLSYLGALPGNPCSVTSEGLAFTINSLEIRRFRYGVPRSFQLSALLSLNQEEQVERALNFSKSSIGSNTLLAWENSQIIDLEELWESREKFENKNEVVHTNHPLLKKDQNKGNTEAESVNRYTRAVKLLQKHKKPTLSLLKKILEDHEGRICKHYGMEDDSVTINSTILSPNGRWIEVCAGNPCRAKYKRYYLK